MGLDLQLLGAALRRIREEQGHSQEEVARLMGSSHSSISNWERGTREPELNKLWDLLQVLKSGLCDLERTMVEVADATDPEGAQLIERFKAEVGRLPRSEIDEFLEGAFAEKIEKAERQEAQRRAEMERRLASLEQEMATLRRRLGESHEGKISKSN